MQSVRTPDLEPQELSDLLSRMQARFDWDEPAEQFAVVDRWRSRTASFYRCRGQPGGPDVVVKAAHGWTGEMARATYAEMGRLQRLLAVRGEPQVFGLSPLGWDENPPSVAMPHLQGTDLKTVLRDSGHDLWKGSLEAMQGLVWACGRGLGSYHSAEAPGPGEERAAISEAMHNVATSAHRVMIRSTTATKVAGSPVVSRHYNDCGPNNFRVVGERICLLDPPRFRRFASIHRDVAWFTFQLQENLRFQRAALEARELEDRQHQLGEAFLEGYAGTGPRDVRTIEDSWLIVMYGAYRAQGMARKRWREGKYEEALWFLSWAWRLRAALRLRQDSPLEVSPG